MGFYKGIVGSFHTIRLESVRPQVLSILLEKTPAGAGEEFRHLGEPSLGLPGEIISHGGRPNLVSFRRLLIRLRIRSVREDPRAGLQG